LGDSILGAMVATDLFEQFPGMDAGKLTRMKISLVSGKTLSDVAGKLGVGELIVFGESEKGTGARGLRSALEDVYEALVGALYLDGGYEAAHDFVARTLHPQIMPMLKELKAAGMKLAVISNCYHEEAQVIREWEGSRCFDTLVLSCEEGVCKPDPEIFRRCMARLGVMPQECLFVGDGGSRELETARSLGMEAMQAVWYMKGVEDHPSSPKKDFVQLEEPRDVLAAVCRLNGWTDALSENHCLPTKNESETAGRA
jgi:HAD superfamily hydrolase (TIGR01509 family)